MNGRVNMKNLREKSKLLCSTTELMNKSGTWLFLASLSFFIITAQIKKLSVHFPYLNQEWRSFISLFAKAWIEENLRLQKLNRFKAQKLLLRQRERERGKRKQKNCKWIGLADIVAFIGILGITYIYEEWKKGLHSILSQQYLQLVYHQYSFFVYNPSFFQRLNALGYSKQFQKCYRSKAHTPRTIWILVEVYVHNIFKLEFRKILFYSCA